MKKIILFISLITIALLTSCTTRKIGWVETNFGSTFKASYQFFDGRATDTIKLNEGETLSLSYDLRVEDGALTLQLENPDGDILWEETFQENDKATVDFISEADGRVRLMVFGEETQGEFNFTWEIID